MTPNHQPTPAPHGGFKKRSDSIEKDKKDLPASSCLQRFTWILLNS